MKIQTSYKLVEQLLELKKKKKAIKADLKFISKMNDSYSEYESENILGLGELKLTEDFFLNFINNKEYVEGQLTEVSSKIEETRKILLERYLEDSISNAEDLQSFLNRESKKIELNFFYRLTLTNSNEIFLKFSKIRKKTFLFDCNSFLQNYSDYKFELGVKDTEDYFREKETWDSLPELLNYEKLVFMSRSFMQGLSYNTKEKVWSFIEW